MKNGDGLDVDLLARYPTRGEDLIQVSADGSSSDTLSRELRTLATAAREHPRATRRLLVLYRDALTEVFDWCRGAARYEWLLSETTEP